MSPVLSKTLPLQAPPIELEVVNAKMPKSPTSFTFTPQVLGHAAVHSALLIRSRARLD